MILIVDDSLDTRLLLKKLLEKNHLSDIILAASANEAFEILHKINTENEFSSLDLILMDIMMPDINGIDVCRRIRKEKYLKDIPIIMVTGKTEATDLKRALEAGATDYIKKPFDKVELLARVRSALRLKREMDKRKEKEAELLALTEKLQKLSSVDGLTGIANRRLFDEQYEKEFNRAKRNRTSLSLVLIDIDHFKQYNDTYGHQKGDDCLKEVAQSIADSVCRPGDLAARYGGEEFVVVLPDTDQLGAAYTAENIRSHVASLQLEHKCSSVSQYVTVSVGVASSIPDEYMDSKMLIELADKGLYKAKEHGRNHVVFQEYEGGSKYE